jgi:hypothetical protein
LRAGAHFAMTQAINYRGITSGVSGYATTPSHLSEAVNAFRSRNNQFPRQFPRFPSLPATELITVRPHTFPPTTAFPAPALAARQPPRSHALTWPHASRGRAGSGLRARTRGEYLIRQDDMQQERYSCRCPPSNLRRTNRRKLMGPRAHHPLMCRGTGRLAVTAVRLLARNRRSGLTPDAIRKIRRKCYYIRSAAGRAASRR